MAGVGLAGVKGLVEVGREDMAGMPRAPGVFVTVTGNSVVFTTVISSLTSGRVEMTFLGLALAFSGLIIIYRDWVKAFTPVVTMFMVIGWAGGVMYYSGRQFTPLTDASWAVNLGVGS